MGNLRGVRSILVYLSLTTFALAKSVDDRVSPVPADQPVPSSDYIRAWMYHDPTMNHAGTALVAKVRTPAKGESILLDDFRTGRTLVATGTGFTVDKLQWITDDEFCLLSDYGQIYPGHFGIFAKCFDWKEVDWARKFISDNSPSFFNSHPEGRQYPDVYHQIALDTHWPHYPSGLRVRAFADQLTGLPVALVFQRDGVRRIYRYDHDQWIECPVDADRYHLIAAGTNPNEAIVSVVADQTSAPAVYRMDLPSGKLGAMLGRDENYEASGVEYSGDGRSLVGINFDGVYPKTTWIDPRYQAAQRIVQHQIPGAFNTLLQSDDSGKHLLVESLSDRQPPVYYLADLNQRSFELLKAAAPWIDSKRMNQTKAFRYKTRDGLELDGTLVLAPGTSVAHPGPLLVLLNSPTHAQQAKWEWNGLSQIFSHWGYTVFVPSNRAADGLRWQAPIQQTWDFRLLQHDYEDGIAFLLKTGLFDPHDVGVIGKGFGMAQALTLAIDRPDLVHLAVVYPGYCDVVKYYHDHPEKNLWFDEAQHRLGTPQDNLNAYAALDPLRRIADLKVPICLFDTGYFAGDFDLQLPDLDDALGSRGIRHTDIREQVDYVRDDVVSDTEVIYTKLHRFLNSNFPVAPAGGRISQ